MGHEPSPAGSYAVKRWWIIGVLVLGGWVAGTPTPAWGIVYQWTDESGTVHYTDDLGQVPPHLRSKAKPVKLTPAATPPPENASPPPPPDPVSPAARSPSPAAVPQGVTVRYFDSGGGMYVKVQVAGQVETWMLFDTGATFCTISRSLADAIGIRYDSGTPIMILQTANGVKVESFVRIPSLRIGSLEVRNVAATVDVPLFSRGAQTPPVPFDPKARNGILGLSFLDHFIVKLDPGDGTLTFIPRPQKDPPETYGGHSRRWWQKQFAFYRRVISGYARAVERLKAASTPETYRELKARMDLSIRYFENELRELEHQAALYGVPLEWRR